MHAKIIKQILAFLYIDFIYAFYNQNRNFFYNEVATVIQVYKFEDYLFKEERTIFRSVLIFNPLFTTFIFLLGRIGM